MAESVGQTVCPMLSEPGQQLADVAANVSDAIGKPLGPATTFTAAITIFCPGLVASLARRDADPAGDARLAYATSAPGSRNPRGAQP